MNSDIVKGKFNQTKGDIKKFFGNLTDDDMLKAEGGRDKMVGVLQERYGYTADKAESEWKRYENQHGSVYEAADAVSNAVEDAKHGVHESVKDAGRSIRDAAQSVKDKVEDTKDAIVGATPGQELTKDAKRAAREMKDAVRDAKQDAQDAVDHAAKKIGK